MLVFALSVSHFDGHSPPARKINKLEKKRELSYFFFAPPATEREESNRRKKKVGQDDVTKDGDGDGGHGGEDAFSAGREGGGVGRGRAVRGRHRQEVSGVGGGERGAPTGHVGEEDQGEGIEESRTPRSAHFSFFASPPFF